MKRYASLDAETIIFLLGLKPLPDEGGYFSETYRSSVVFHVPATGLRSSGTAIYYLVTPTSFSALHKVKSDEIFHFYAGDAVDMLMISDDGNTKIVGIGTDLIGGDRPQVVVGAGTWQGCRQRDGGAWALLGCTVSPGFSHDDFELAQRENLLAKYPQISAEIRKYTVK